MNDSTARENVLDRALSVGRWLAHLPEVSTEGSGPSKTFEYVRGDLRDF